MRPLVRWSGSKKQMVSRLRRMWQPTHKRYIELFAGSACLFFDIEPPAAVLADKNRDLMHSYSAVRDKPKAVHQALQKMGCGSDEYARVRALDPSSLTPAIAAARFIYLMRNCYGGVYRTNRSGRFNVPYGGNSTGQLPTLEELQSASRLLAKAQLHHGDFADAVNEYRPGDLVYLDPPYTSSTDRKGLQYGYDSFLSDDFSRLTDELNRIVEAGADFVLSYADNETARRALSAYHVSTETVRRSLPRNPKARGAEQELLCTSFDWVPS